MQLVEPVLGLIPQQHREPSENPDLTLIDLLDLMPCDQYVTTPLHTLDGTYVNQPSQFLQEAKNS